MDVPSQISSEKISNSKAGFSALVINPLAGARVVRKKNGWYLSPHCRDDNYRCNRTNIDDAYDSAVRYPVL
jgi:hypothetical protein